MSPQAAQVALSKALSRLRTDRYAEEALITPEGSVKGGNDLKIQLRMPCEALSDREGSRSYNRQQKRNLQCFRAESMSVWIIAGINVKHIMGQCFSYQWKVTGLFLKP